MKQKLPPRRSLETQKVPHGSRYLYCARLGCTRRHQQYWEYVGDLRPQLTVYPQNLHF